MNMIVGTYLQLVTKILIQWYNYEICVEFPIQFKYQANQST